MANTIVRSFKVDRTRTPQAALDATGRKQYVNGDIVATMPTKGLVEGQMEFFKPDPSSYVNGVINDAALAKEFELRELDPDPLAQAAINEADPVFAKDHPNGTHWPLEGGGFGFLTFYEWSGERDVSCYRSVGWDDRWVFGGVRKVSK